MQNLHCNSVTQCRICFLEFSYGTLRIIDPRGDLLMEKDRNFIFALNSFFFVRSHERVLLNVTKSELVPCKQMNGNQNLFIS